jgi:hypothetical protein
MSRRFIPNGLSGRCLAGGLAFVVAGAMLLTDARAAPTGSRERPAARAKTPAQAKTPARPAAAPPRRKATPRATPPSAKRPVVPPSAKRPVVPPKKKRTRLEPPRRDLRPRLPERPRPDITPSKPVEKTMRKLQGAAWAMVGITAVLLTFTGVFALMVEDREDEMERMASFVDPYSDPPMQPLPYEGRTKRDFEQYNKEGRHFEIVGFTFLGLSAAAAIAATTLFVLDHVTKKRKESSLRVRPILGPRGGGVTLGLEF